MKEFKFFVAFTILFFQFFYSHSFLNATPEKNGLKKDKVTTILLWHSYRGKEKDALENIVKKFNKRFSRRFRVLYTALPFDSMEKKLNLTIPRGNGPDIFVFPHNQTGNFADVGLILPVSKIFDSDFMNRFFEKTTKGFLYKNKIYGIPLAFKCTILFYNKEYIKKPPETTNKMIELALLFQKNRKNGYGLVYDASNFYFHEAFFSGFGGKLFDEKGNALLDSPEMVASLKFLKKIVVDLKIVPDEVTGAKVASMFNQKLTPMVINGPWFLGEISEKLKQNFNVSVLPKVSETGLAMKPFLTVEGVFVSSKTGKFEAIKTFLDFLTNKENSVFRAEHGRQLVATKDAYNSPVVAKDQILMTFYKQLNNTVLMDNSPRMSYVWEPLKIALNRVIRGTTSPEEAAKFAMARYKVLARKPPKPVSPTPYLVLLSMFLLALAFILVNRAKKLNFMAEFKKTKHAYLYLLPAFFGLTLVLFIPFVIGTGISFFIHRGGHFTFVGLKNFINILFSKDYSITDPFSMYFTLGVTVLWTVLNVFLHVTLGLILAMILRHPWMKLRGIYRVLLIIPWAIPNYITALIWKGMFDRQFGAINGILAAMGLTPISWFSKFTTAFSANLITNTWLGFPFMMVITLGALQSIPKELEEAAEIDGATPFYRFKKVIFPLLKPALLPAVIMGTIWTFNMFNVIYLVSGGEPDGATEILITEAYKWAFERNYQYGYAAAYATIIFIILLVYSKFTGKLLGEKKVVE